MKKILITGGTGFIGSLLTNRLAKDGNIVTILTRDPGKLKKAYKGVRYLSWNSNSADHWIDELNEHEIIIHAAGAGLFNKRWSRKYKQQITDSRVLSAQKIVNAIKPGNTSVRTLISASAIGYYGDTGSNAVSESAPSGKDFLADLCSRWENEVSEASVKNIRVASMRMGIILSTKGGFLNRLLPLFRLLLGSSLGSRSNYISWVHPDDLVNAYLFTINNDISGPLNITSPHPVTSGEFASSLGKELKRPAVFTVPASLIRLVVGEGGKYVTYSQKVLPEKLLKSGFRFSYTELKTALHDILRNQK